MDYEVSEWNSAEVGISQGISAKCELPERQAGQRV